MSAPQDPSSCLTLQILIQPVYLESRMGTYWALVPGLGIVNTVRAVQSCLSETQR